MNPSESFADFATIRTVELQRLATWMLADMVTRLDELQLDVIGLIATIDPSGVVQYAARQNRLYKLLEEIETKLRAVYKEMEKRLVGWFEETAELQQADERDQILLLFGIKLSKPALTMADMLILGFPLKDWLAKQRTDLLFRIQGRLADKLEADTTGTGELIAAIKGTPDAGFKDGVFSASKRELETIIRTAADKVPNEVLNAYAEQIADDASEGGEIKTEDDPATVIRLGYQQISILDNRTTETCRAYAWKKWNVKFEPVGHKMPYNGGPPRHAYCRSRIVVIDLDDPGSEEDFQKWLRAKTAEDAQKIFGKKKMDLWSAGKLSDSDLIRQTDRQLTLDEFRARVKGDQ